MRSLAFLLAVCVALPALADEEPSPTPPLPEAGFRDVVHARTLAMGGAYQSVGLGADVVIGNPAAMALFKRYQAELSGTYDIRSRFGFGSVAVLDSVTNQVAAGVSYSFISLGQGDEQRFAHLTTVAAGMPLSEVLYVGFSTHNLVESGARTANAITIDGAVLLRFSSLAISVTGHNLIDIRNPDMSRYFVGSVGWMSEVFTLVGDLKMDFQGTSTPQFAYSLGAEFIAGQTLPLRAGFLIDTITQNRYLCMGAGFLSEGSGVDIAYRHEIGGANGRMLALTLKMQL
jgi:hypothetical protein